VQRARITLVDDIDGSAASETVHFALDGVRYAIDLSDERAADLRESLAAYVEHGRRVGGRARHARHVAPVQAVVGDTPPAAKSEAAKIRVWAAAQGVTVAPVGQISAEVKRRYRQAQVEAGSTVSALSQQRAKKGTKPRRGATVQGV
jgi:hypothetical protein